MSSITVYLPDNLKESTQKQAKKDGVTMTFVIIQSLQAYKDGKLKFGLLGWFEASLENLKEWHIG